VTIPLVRVTQVVFDLDGGGLESLVADLARRFHGTSVLVSVITLSGRVGRVGATVRDLVHQYHVLRPVRVASMIAPLGLVRAIRATRPDVVHLHSGAWFKPAFAARLAGVPGVVYTEHGREHDDPVLARWLDRRASRLTDAVVAVSDRLRTYLRDQVGIASHRLITIPNGVDTVRFAPGVSPPDLRASLGIPGGALVLGSIGRLEPVKAYDRLLDAYARIRAVPGGPVMILVLGGDGSSRAALEAQVDRLGIRDGVRLPGWMRPDDAYRLMDVFALTSLSEGMSVSLLEAMASGVCPLVMDVGANAELLGPQLSAQVVPAGDLDAFCEALAATVLDPERRRLASLAGRARVVSEFGLDAMTARYGALYHSLVARGRRAE
jgi:glycosyltransferase involved in cell wall biosynthesis